MILLIVTKLFIFSYIEVEKMFLNKEKVVVGMSGGVDSTATAYLLKEKGYEVIGVTMLLFDGYDKEGNVIEPPFIADAKRVSKKMGIEHHVLDLRSEFKKLVVDDFIEEYEKGNTPNPCVVCNKHIKYGALVNYAKSLGAYYFATGHYANIVYEETSGRYIVKRGVSDRKDQAYVLHSLTQDVLKHIILPLGEFNNKEDVRKIALNVEDFISKKTDSWGICFIPDGSHRTFLNQINIGNEPGEVVDVNGEFLGNHNGLNNYTIGQKRNLGIKLDKTMFVVEIDAKNNRLILGDDKDTFSREIIIENVNFIRFSQLKEKLRCQIKVCHWGYYLDGVIMPISENSVRVVFDEKIRAATRGQAAVFYIDNEVIGGGRIKEIIK